MADRDVNEVSFSTVQPITNNNLVVWVSPFQHSEHSKLIRGAPYEFASAAWFAAMFDLLTSFDDSMGSGRDTSGFEAPEEGLGATQGQGGDHGMHEEGLGAGGQDMSAQKEEGLGRGGTDISADRDEEGLAQGGADRSADSGEGMGSGRPAGEKGEGIIPGHHHHHKEKEEGGESTMDKLKDKAKGLFHKDK